MRRNRFFIFYTEKIYNLAAFSIPLSSLLEGVSVRPSVGTSVGPLVRLTIRKISKNASFARKIGLSRCHFAIQGERPAEVAFIGRVSGLVCFLLRRGTTSFQESMSVRLSVCSSSHFSVGP